MFHMLRMSRWLIPIVLLAICFAEDRNWEEANQLLVKASEAETFKPEQPKFHLTVKVLLQHTTKGKLAGTFDRDIWHRNGGRTGWKSLTFARNVCA
jgi:hypothetical protein